MSRWIRRIVLLGLLVVALAGLVAQIIKVVLPEAIISAPNRGQRIDPARDRAGAALRALGVARALRVEVGPPRASLHVWLFEPRAGRRPRGTVLVLHGIGDRKDSFVGDGRELARRGFRAVLVDHRGHGRSSGNFLSYGARETRDMRQLLDALARRELLAPPLAVLGFSYGAAVAVQLAGRDRRVRAAVAVAPFVSLREIAEAYLRRLAPLVHHLVDAGDLDRAIAAAGVRGGFAPWRASPLRAIRFIRGELLLIHGRADAHIPFAHSQRLLAAAPKGRARLLAIDGADHISVMGHPRARREMMVFLEQKLPSPPATRAP